MYKLIVSSDYLTTEEGIEVLRQERKYFEKKSKEKWKMLFIERPEFYINADEKTLAEIINVFKYIGVEPHNLGFSSSSYKYVFRNEEWNKIKNVETYLAKRGVSFGFEDLEMTWDLKEVENANNKVKSITNEIKKHNFSPLEKLLYGYISVTSPTYKINDFFEHYSKSRSIYGVLNSEKIVCVGYANLLSAFLEEVDSKNLKPYINMVKVSEDGKTAHAYHANLIVYVKDEKYNIDGYYYFDPTWDAGHEKFSDYPSLNFFMLPLKDINNNAIAGEYIFSENKKMHENLDEDKPARITKYTNRAPDFINCCYSPSSRRLAKAELLETVSFAGDGYWINPYFIYDYIFETNEDNYEFAKELLIERFTGKLNNTKARLENLEFIEALLEEKGLTKVTENDFQKIWEEYKKTNRNKNYKNFNKLCNEIKYKYQYIGENVLFKFLECSNKEKTDDVSRDKRIINNFFNKNPEYISVLHYNQDILDDIHNEILNIINTESYTEHEIKTCLDSFKLKDTQELFKSKYERKNKEIVSLEKKLQQIETANRDKFCELFVKLNFNDIENIAISIADTIDSTSKPLSIGDLFQAVKNVVYHLPLKYNSLDDLEMYGKPCSEYDLDYIAYRILMNSVEKNETFKLFEKGSKNPFSVWSQALTELKEMEKIEEETNTKKPNE